MPDLTVKPGFARSFLSRYSIKGVLLNKKAWQVDTRRSIWASGNLNSDQKIPLPVPVMHLNSYDKCRKSFVVFRPGKTEFFNERMAKPLSGLSKAVL